MMGIGRATGENRAIEAAEQAVSSPLLEETIDGATGVILNITGGENMSLHEVHNAADVIYSAVDPEANILFGSVIDERLHDEIVVTVIATGFKRTSRYGHYHKPEAAFTEPAESEQPEEVHYTKKEKEVISPPSADLDDIDNLDVPAFLRNLS